MRFVKDDTLAPYLAPGHHAYRIEDTAGRVRGMVSSGPTSVGRVAWWAYRPMPSRTTPWVVACVAETRAAAAERLIGGRP